MTANWLAEYLATAVQRGLCTRVFCTTCGATEFRLGLKDALLQSGAAEATEWSNGQNAILIIVALSSIKPPIANAARFEEAVRFILCSLWDSPSVQRREIERLLGYSWARSVLVSMQQRHAQGKAKNELQVLMAQHRREQTRLAKLEQQIWRALKKKDRDLRWHKLNSKKQ